MFRLRWPTAVAFQATNKARASHCTVCRVRITHRYVPSQVDVTLPLLPKSDANRTTIPADRYGVPQPRKKPRLIIIPPMAPKSYSYNVAESTGSNPDAFTRYRGIPPSSERSSRAWRRLTFGVILNSRLKARHATVGRKNMGAVGLGGLLCIST